MNIGEGAGAYSAFSAQPSHLSPRSCSQVRSFFTVIFAQSTAGSSSANASAAKAAISRSSWRILYTK